MDRVILLTDEEQHKVDLTSQLDYENARKKFWQEQIKQADQRIKQATADRAMAYSSLFGNVSPEIVAIKNELFYLDHPKTEVVEEKLTRGQKLIRGAQRIFLNVNKESNRQVRHS